MLNFSGDAEGSTNFYDMLKQNKDIDYQNIPENGFKTKKEVDEWWKNKEYICKI